jgi:hypothetical protein
VAGVGSACLTVGLLTALYAAGASLYGVRGGNGVIVVQTRRIP